MTTCIHLRETLATSVGTKSQHTMSMNLYRFLGVVHTEKATQHKHHIHTKNSHCLNTGTSVLTIERGPYICKIGQKNRQPKIITCWLVGKSPPSTGIPRRKSCHISAVGSKMIKFILYPSPDQFLVT